MFSLFDGILAGLLAVVLVAFMKAVNEYEEYRRRMEDDDK